MPFESIRSTVCCTTGCACVTLDGLGVSRPNVSLEIVLPAERCVTLCALMRAFSGVADYVRLEVVETGKHFGAPGKRAAVLFALVFCWRNRGRRGHRAFVEGYGVSEQTMENVRRGLLVKQFLVHGGHCPSHQ